VHNTLGSEIHLRQVLELTDEVKELLEQNPILSQQYRMAAECEATAAHLGLANCLKDPEDKRAHLAKALACSQAAVEVFESFGYAQIVECVSEEVFYRRSLALSANAVKDEASLYLQKAYDEMMRKYNLLPASSHYRKTYLENIALHRDILTANAAQVFGSRS
jgi:hypothetical protein